MSLGVVLVTGLLAGGVSCAAVQGGLLAGLVTRQRGGTVAAVPGATYRQAGRREGGSASAGRSDRRIGRYGDRGKDEDGQADPARDETGTQRGAVAEFRKAAG